VVKIKTQNNEEIRFYRVDVCIKLLTDIEKSNLSIHNKMLLSQIFGFLHGIDEVQYIEDGEFI